MFALWAAERPDAGPVDLQRMRRGAMTSITKRFKGQWCVRAKIWWPEGGSHGSLEVEGGLSERYAKVLTVLLTERVDEESHPLLLGKLEAIAEEIKAARNDDHED